MCGRWGCRGLASWTGDILADMMKMREVAQWIYRNRAFSVEGTAEQSSEVRLECSRTRRGVVWLAPGGEKV